MKFDTLRTPLSFLKAAASHIPQPDWLLAFETWWETEGRNISDSVDRAGTPWLRMFDRLGARVDEILYPPEYWKMLKQGYQTGLMWRVFEEDSLLPAYLGIYVTSFYDPDWRARTQFPWEHWCPSRNMEIPNCSSAFYPICCGKMKPPGRERLG